ncbi:hypothetical protein CCP2SC5_750008 [Azospirillaceae bacterium]
MDIDCFKLYNDHYGHLEGDECLKQVAQTISKSMSRRVDLAARYGGEEFACVLPETKQEGALSVAERLLKSVHALKIPHATSKAAKHITLSIGVASLTPSTVRRVSELIELADKSLYNAKQNGRNRIASLDV